MAIQHTLNDDKARTKVWELIKDIRIAQLVTHGEGDFLNARPMAAMNKDFDGALWFFTEAGSPKISEIQNNAHILLIFNKPSDQEYVSVQGRAEVLNDRKRITELWSEAARIWFPKGTDDPSIRLIRVDVSRAEYWDSPSSTLVMIYGYAVARLTGETPKVGDNKKVAFNGH